MTVPVYGHVAYTHSLVRDLEREGVDYVIVDNKGDYTPLGHERVLTPESNLGWAQASNLGFRLAFAEGHRNAMTLNNDVRLSRGFFDGYLDSRLPDNVGAVTALYDDRRGHPAQLAEFRGPAHDYEPSDRFRELRSIDGTAMMICREAWIKVGGFEGRSFGTFSWGANLDLCIRLRNAGFAVVATELSFHNHFRGKTAATVTNTLNYNVSGVRHLRKGMKAFHGKKWQALIDDRSFTVRDLDDTSHVVEDSARRLLNATTE
ncbi:glycosyltransferase family 2 protein [Williamsia sp. MIQD14]|uniref:glycosyltransferase family 2 protein n=1 Tax=Williamsia sp. MIQD14 TaxID=3425703 RepID=UPI003D9FD412